MYLGKSASCSAASNAGQVVAETGPGIRTGCKLVVIRPEESGRNDMHLSDCPRDSARSENVEDL